MDDKSINLLIETARELVNKRTDGSNHTVAAAVITQSGEVFTSMNFFHFTGGPCAEIAVLARVVSDGNEPVAIVAIGDKDRGILPPCGRCRQVMFDYYPDLQVIMPNESGYKVNSLLELLPGIYSWNDQQVEQ
jgi:cytidine deaminase